MRSNVFVRNAVVIFLWWILWLCLVYWEVQRGVSNIQQAIYFSSLPATFFAVWWANRGLFSETEEPRRLWLVLGVSGAIWAVSVYLAIVIGVNFKFSVGGRI